MNTQAKVALDKQANPDRYCKTPGCLWKVKHLVTDLVFGQVYIFHDNCPGGRCPRHQKVSQLTLGPNGECPHCGKTDCRCDKEHYL